MSVVRRLLGRLRRRRPVDEEEEAAGFVTGAAAPYLVSRAAERRLEDLGVETGEPPEEWVDEGADGDGF